MKRPLHGFTLIEILVATALSLVVLGAVITLFGNVSNNIADSRSMLEAADRLRLAQERLQMDLAGLTVSPNPPRKPENNEGYLEIIEGPATATSLIAKNTDVTGSPDDTTVGDFDDILMLTTRSTGRPFIGKFGGGVIQSDVAEVAWFLRGRTLHRRVLLVKPGAFASRSKTDYYSNNDISVYSLDANTVAPNTLGDLTRRECRYAHPGASLPYAIPWTWSSGGSFPTLPTLNECSINGWFPTTTSHTLSNPLDFWTNVPGHRLEDNAFNSGNATGSRPSDDIILTNVIGFDVKVWDTVQNAYMDLGHGNSNINGFGHNGYGALNSSSTRTYDTWSTTYFDAAWNNGLDDGVSGANGIVDDDSEKGANNLPPYPVPLRGIQVKIRTFEPDSKQVREVTVVQDFLPQ